MKLALPILAVLVVLLAATRARAEGDAPGFAPAAAGGTGFGAPGQVVLSMGPTTDEHLFLHKQSGGGWQLQLSPALDYFLTSRVAVGGVVGFRHDSGAGNGTNRILLGVRASTNLDINDRFSFWPLGGLSFAYSSANHSSSSNTWLNLFAPFLFHLAPHFFVGLGPSFQLNLQGSNDSQYGLDSVLGGWF